MILDMMNKSPKIMTAAKVEAVREAQRRTESDIETIKTVIEDPEIIEGRTNTPQNGGWIVGPIEEMIVDVMTEEMKDETRHAEMNESTEEMNDVMFPPLHTHSILSALSHFQHLVTSDRPPSRPQD